jgi:hypothetical protein
MRQFRPTDLDAERDRDRELDEDAEARRAAELAPGRRPRVHRAASGAQPSPAARAALDRAAARAGQPLTPTIRARLERALGVELGAVRVHTDEAAAAAAEAVGAHAYTVGQDIFFADGAFQPDTQRGFRLIAHEVVHTVQQGAQTGGHGELDVSSPTDAIETEAERVADAVAAEPDAGAVAAVASAITPRARGGDPVQARLDATARAAREADAPGALPLTIASTSTGRIARDDAPAGSSGGGDGGDATLNVQSKAEFDPTFVTACELHGAGCDGNHRLHLVADIGFTPTVTSAAAPTRSMAHDSIQAGGISLATPVARTGSPPSTAFGYATPHFTSDLKATVQGTDTVVVTGTMTVDIKWGTQSLGRTNVSSADDPVVQPDNFMTIYYDLVPQNGRTGKKERFWVQAFTEAHEQVHIADYTADSAKETKAAIQWLQSQKIDIPGKIRSFLGAKSAEAQIKPWLDEFATRVGKGVQESYFAGGEAHAYGAGVQAYQDLADAIKNKGFKLGWDKKSKNKGGSIGDPNAPPPPPSSE